MYIISFLLEDTKMLSGWCSPSAALVPFLPLSSESALPLFSVLVLKLAPFPFFPPLNDVASLIQVKAPYLWVQNFFKMEAAVHKKKGWLVEMGKHLEK